MVDIGDMWLAPPVQTPCTKAIAAAGFEHREPSRLGRKVTLRLTRAVRLIARTLNNRPCHRFHAAPDKPERPGGDLTPGLWRCYLKKALATAAEQFTSESARVMSRPPHRAFRLDIEPGFRTQTAERLELRIHRSSRRELG